MAKGRSGGGNSPAPKNNDGRNNAKAFKKHPKVFDPIKRRLVPKEK